MPSVKGVLLDRLKEEGFGVKITDGGVIAYLGSRKPSRHELVGAVPELEGFPMETTDEGVLIPIGKERFLT